MSEKHALASHILKEPGKCQFFYKDRSSRFLFLKMFIPRNMFAANPTFDHHRHHDHDHDHHHHHHHHHLIVILATLVKISGN